MNKAYYIGGSPCCGKSTIAKMIADKYNFKIYRVDNYLDDYMKMMADSGNLLAKKVLAMNMEEMWMRDPEVLCDEELEIYKGMFSYIKKGINEFKKKSNLIAEGAGLLPKLMREMEVEERNYVCMVPTKSFQVEQYSDRSWIKHYLSGCTDPEEAFKNWMERDARFAKVMLQEAKEMEYKSIVVDGLKSIGENFQMVEKIFNL